MPRYEKIDDNTFTKITENRVKVNKHELVRHKQKLKKEIDNLNKPSNAELREYGKSFHPYYVDLTGLQVEWQKVKDLIEHLESL